MRRWAEQIYLKPDTSVFDWMVSRDFMAGGCALPTALHAVERGDIAMGDRALCWVRDLSASTHHSCADARSFAGVMHRRAR